MDEVSAADALHALKVHLTPLFDSSAVLVASSPASKASELAISLGEAHAGEPLLVIPEEELYSKFGTGAKVAVVDELGGPEKPTTGGTGKSAGGRGAKSGISKQYKCECPKCDPAFQVKIAFGGRLALPLS